MDTEKALDIYRDADTWPAEKALDVMLDNQMNAITAVRAAVPALAAAVRAASCTPQPHMNAG